MIDKIDTINIVEINKNTDKDKDKSIEKVKAKVGQFPKSDKKVSRKITNKDKIDKEIIIRILPNKNKRLQKYNEIGFNNIKKHDKTIKLKTYKEKNKIITIVVDNLIKKENIKKKIEKINNHK
jgi:hypothetical protein